MKERFKFRIWNNVSNSYEPLSDKTVITMRGECATIKDYGLFHMDNGPWIIEQCTGLKDKNGNLIYECDLLEAGGRRYVVCWAHHGFVMRFTPDSASSYPLGGTDLFEIIGNIHEQKEQE